MRTRRVIKKQTTKDDILVCLGFAVHIGRGILHDTIATGTWYYCSGLGLILLLAFLWVGGKQRSRIHPTMN